MSFNDWSVANSTRSMTDVEFNEQSNRFRFQYSKFSLSDNLYSNESNPNERHNKNLKMIFKILCPITIIIIIVCLLCLILIPLVQAVLNSNTNKTNCKSQGLWNGSSCVINATSNITICASQYFWNGSICIKKKLYQEICDSSKVCDDTKRLICPTIPALCNCPNTSTSYKCDCSPDSFWDFTKKECTLRKSYGENCSSDYQCLSNRNFYCNGVCICPLTLLWNGYMCDLNFYRFFIYTSVVTSVSVCGNYSISNGRSIEPGNSLNYVMDVNNDIVAIFDSDWNCHSVESILKPRFMKVVGNDFYISTDNGLKKFDSNFNNLIALNTSWNYRRLHYDSSNNHIIANNPIETRIDTFDRNLNLVDSFDLKKFNYSQSASGLYLYKDYWFIGTGSSQVIIVKNKTIVSVYQNVCSVKSSVNVCVDNYGNMVVACNSDKKLYLYYTNGTYQNLYLNTTSFPNYLNYDSKGRIVATGGGSVDIFS